MRSNGTPAPSSPEPSAGGVRRVTSITRWLSRRKASAAQPAPAVSVVMPVYNAEAFRRDSHRVMDVTRRTPPALGSGDDGAGVPLERMG